jgi:tetratricopeptide (TPR) repeat protein
MQHDKRYADCTLWHGIDVAIAWHREGRLSQAAVLYENALANDAMNVGVLNLLALLRGQQGDQASAATLIDRALKLDPTLAADDRQTVNFPWPADRFRDTAAANLETNRRSLARAAACANLGLHHLQRAQFDRAWRLLSRATKLQPDWHVCWEFLADLHRRLEQYQAAVRCWNRALSLAPDNRAYPHIALGCVLEELNRGDEAADHFFSAVAIEPESAEAHAKLGEFLMVQGRTEEAEAAFRTVLRLQPTHDLARGRLVLLLQGKLPDDDLNAILSRLDAPGAAPESRVRLLFALGLVHDARGEYMFAVKRLREANALKLSLTPAPRCFQPAEHEKFVAGLMRAFTPDFFCRTAGGGLNTRRPVFIVGLPRSGTTLLEHVLASHARVHGAGELRLGRRLFDSLPMILETTASPFDCVRMLDSGTVRRLARSYLVRLQAVGDDQADRIIDKQPENYFYLGLLISMFPEATIIHCRRDLRDVALSCWMTDSQDVLWANDPGHIAVNFHSYLQLMDHWRSVLPTTIIEVRYEELVVDLEGVTRSLLGAMELEWDPACLDFHRTRRPVRTASVNQVRRPLRTNSVGRWKVYEEELTDLFAALPDAPS